MITKREKLQYIYVFLTDLVVLLLSTLLAWLVTDGLLKQLVPYAPSDWVQTICLLMLAFVATFICFDQTPAVRKSSFPSSSMCCWRWSTPPPCC